MIDRYIDRYYKILNVNLLPWFRILVIRLRLSNRRSTARGRIRCRCGRSSCTGQWRLQSLLDILLLLLKKRSRGAGPFTIHAKVNVEQIGSFATGTSGAGTTSPRAIQAAVGRLPLPAIVSIVVRTRRTPKELHQVILLGKNSTTPTPQTSVGCDVRRGSVLFQADETIADLSGSQVAATQRRTSPRIEDSIAQEGMLRVRNWRSSLTNCRITK